MSCEGIRPTPTGDGKHEVRPDGSLLLYNFSIDGVDLKEEHKTALNTNVVPVLRGGGSVTIVGLASRTGSHEHNMRISSCRVVRTHEFLRRRVSNGFSLRQALHYGEMAAGYEGQPDNREDQRFRSVVVYFWARQDPPQPNITSVEVVGADIDVPDASSWLQVIPTIIDGAATAAGAVGSQAAIVFLLETGGIGAALVGGVLAWAHAQERGQQLARFNGRCRGVWNAYEDMARPFCNSRLDQIPQNQWPEIPQPSPRTPRPDPRRSLPADVQAWEGEQEGCRAAYEHVMAMERRPQRVQFTYQGRLISTRMTGRLYLRTLCLSWGPSGIAAAIREEFNRQLEAAGHGRWPVIR